MNHNHGITPVQPNSDVARMLLLVRKLAVAAELGELETADAAEQIIELGVQLRNQPTPQRLS